VEGEWKPIVWGQVILFKGDMKIHGVDIPPQLTRVAVLEVRSGFEAWPLHKIPGGVEKAMRLGQSRGWQLRWLKTDIVLNQDPPPSLMHGHDDPASAAGDSDRTFGDLDPLSTLADIAEDLEGGGIFKDTPPAQDEDQPAMTPILTPNIGVAKDAMAGQDDPPSKKKRRQRKKSTDTSTSTSQLLATK
jgi:hypothetical protein